jgi:hypothetical protein
MGGGNLSHFAKFLLNFIQNENHFQTFEREADLQALPVGSDDILNW